MTKAGDLVSVFVFLFIFTARMPLVTKDWICSDFVYTLRIQEGVSGLVWQENTSN